MFFVQARVGDQALAAERCPDQPFYVIPTDDLFVSDTERSLSALAVELAQRIRNYHPHGPYYLGGMCLAGRVAFAIACELRRQNQEVALLAIIDMSAPVYAQLSRVSALRNFIGRLHWHVHYVLHGNRQQKIDWIAGCFLALGWQISRVATGPLVLSSNRPTLASVAASCDPTHRGSCRQRHNN
jgi:thioesterase domain-containing protein